MNSKQDFHVGNFVKIRWLDAWCDGYYGIVLKIAPTTRMVSVHLQDGKNAWFYKTDIIKVQQQ